jgi:hypothetical protein
VCVCVCGILVGDLEARKHGDLDLIWPDAPQDKECHLGRET